MTMQEQILSLVSTGALGADAQRRNAARVANAARQEAASAAARLAREAAQAHQEATATWLSAVKADKEADRKVNRMYRRNAAAYGAEKKEIARAAKEALDRQDADRVYKARLALADKAIKEHQVEMAWATR
jgi:hypothetical protein